MEWQLCPGCLFQFLAHVLRPLLSLIWSEELTPVPHWWLTQSCTSIFWSQADTNSQIFHGHSCLPPPDLCIVVYVGNRMRFNMQSIDQSTPHSDNTPANVRNCLFPHTIKNVLYILNCKLRGRYHITMCKTSLWFIAHMSHFSLFGGYQKKKNTSKNSSNVSGGVITFPGIHETWEPQMHFPIFFIGLN